MGVYDKDKISELSMDFEKPCPAVDINTPTHSMEFHTRITVQILEFYIVCELLSHTHNMEFYCVCRQFY